MIAICFSGLPLGGMLVGIKPGLPAGGGVMRGVPVNVPVPLSGFGDVVFLETGNVVFFVPGGVVFVEPGGVVFLEP